MTNSLSYAGASGVGRRSTVQDPTSRAASEVSTVAWAATGLAVMASMTARHTNGRDRGPAWGMGPSTVMGSATSIRPMGGGGCIPGSSHLRGVQPTVPFANRSDMTPHLLPRLGAILSLLVASPLAGQGLGAPITRWDRDFSRVAGVSELPAGRAV